MIFRPFVGLPVMCIPNKHVVFSMPFRASTARCRKPSQTPGRTSQSLIAHKKCNPDERLNRASNTWADRGPSYPSQIWGGYGCARTRPPRRPQPSLAHPTPQIFFPFCIGPNPSHFTPLHSPPPTQTPVWQSAALFGIGGKREKSGTEGWQWVGYGRVQHPSAETHTHRSFLCPPISIPMPMPIRYPIPNGYPVGIIYSI